MGKITFVIFPVFCPNGQKTRHGSGFFENFEIFDRAPIALRRSSFTSIGAIETDRGLDPLTGVEISKFRSKFDRRKEVDLRSTSIALRRSNLRSIGLDRLTAIAF